MDKCCFGCHLLLKEPYIECQDCLGKPVVCTDCFSKGREFGEHSSGHSYKVHTLILITKFIKDDLNCFFFQIICERYSVLDQAWTAKEEEILLQGLVQHGLGNWDDIAKAVGSKSAFQCQDHFEKVYVENSAGVLSSAWTRHQVARSKAQPVSFKVGLDAPPRPSTTSQHGKDLGGYNSARGDFDQELDNQAELLVTCLDPDAIRDRLESDLNVDLGRLQESGEDGDKLDAVLELSLIEIYQNKIRQRARLKRIVKEFGLLNKSKTISRSNSYQALLKAGPGYSQLLKFGKVMCSLDFDYLMESLSHEMSLKRQILHLQDYRSHGLTRFASTAIFTKLKLQRDRNLRQVATDSVRDWTCFKSAVNYVKDEDTGQLIPTMARKVMMPLDIVGMPGYEKLTTEEREVCASARVQPDMFLEVKDEFIRINGENEGLRLADARAIVKIDVNKTKKLYEYFLQKGLIVKPVCDSK